MANDLDFTDWTDLPVSGLLQHPRLHLKIKLGENKQLEKNNKLQTNSRIVLRTEPFRNDTHTSLFGERCSIYMKPFIFYFDFR